MTARNPFNEFLQEIISILELTKKAKPQGEVPEDVDAKLDDLERRVELFKKITDDTFTRAGVSNEQIQQALRSINNLPVFEKLFFERMEKVKKDLEATKRAIAIEKSLSKERDAKKNKPTQTRRKKFRPLGGKDDWKRM